MKRPAHKAPLRRFIPIRALKFFVLSGEQTIRGPQDVMRVQVGQAEAGRGADVPMQVSSSGPADLHALVMFVVDATRPFSSPATLP